MSINFQNNQLNMSKVFAVASASKPLNGFLQRCKVKKDRKKKKKKF